MKKYKKEYLEKVKFHDLQPTIKDNSDAVRKSCNDKDSKERNTSGVAVKR